MLFDIHGDIWTDVVVERLKGHTHIIKNRHLDKFKQGGLVGGVFVVWVDPPHDIRPRERFRESINAMSEELIENEDVLSVIKNSNDFYRAIDEDKLAIMLGIEGLSGIGEEVNSIYSLYRLGFRHMSLTWNEENHLATGARGNPDRGLTDLGRQAIEIIEDLGIILDVSHLNDKSFWDVHEATKKPFIATHSNSRTLCDVKRNLTDEQIKAIGTKGGLVGVNAYHEFVHSQPDKKTIDSLIDHIDYIRDLIGIDHIAFGFDFFEYLGENKPVDYSVGVQGFENISKGNNLKIKLRERGYSEEDIEKISYKNFISFMDKILK